MVALIDIEDFDVDFEDEAEVGYLIAKLQAMAHLHGNSLEAEADLWALMDDDDRTAYAAELERIPLGRATFRGLN